MQLRNSILIIIILFSFSMNGFGQEYRSMWLWNYEDILEDRNNAQQELFDLCSNPPGSEHLYAVENYPQQVNLIFFSCLGYVFQAGSESQQKVRNFIKSAHERQIEVHFLTGASAWALPGNPAGYTIIDSLISFIKASEPDARFDGIQYDVEPYTLSQWYAQDLWNAYLQLLNYCNDAVDCSGLNIPFGCAVPFWYDNTPGLAGMQQVIDACDNIAIMDYTDQMGTIVSNAKNEIDYAGQTGKDVFIGVEVQDGGLEDGITFYQEGWGNMEGALFNVNEAYKDSSAFKGFAIHYYRPYSNFTQWGTKNTDNNYPFIIEKNSKVINDTLNFYFKIVDICGSGVDVDATLNGSTVTWDGGDGDFNSGNEKKISGYWQVEDSTDFYFKATSVLQNGNYRVKIRPTDTSAQANYVYKYEVIPVTIDALPTEPKSNTPKEMKLISAYPNPFNNSFTIKYTAKETGLVQINLFNTNGQKIKTLINESKTAGFYETAFHNINLASGVYFISFHNGSHSAIWKLISIK